MKGDGKRKLAGIRWKKGCVCPNNYNESTEDEPKDEKDAEKPEICEPKRKYRRLTADLQQKVFNPLTIASALEPLTKCEDSSLPPMLLRPNPATKLEVERCAEDTDEG